MQTLEDWDVLILINGLEMYLLQGIFIQQLNKRKQETAGHFGVPRKLPQEAACTAQVLPQKGSRFCESAGTLLQGPYHSSDGFSF